MTDGLEQLPQALVHILNGALAGNGARAGAEYPDRTRPAPLTQSLVAVGLQDAELLPRALADFAGLDETGGSVFGRTLEVTAAMNVCCPPAMGSAEAQRIFGLICDVLLFSQREYDVTRCWCGKAAFEKELGALVLPCFARLRMTVTARRDEANIRDFVIRRVSE